MTELDDVAAAFHRKFCGNCNHLDCGSLSAHAYRRLMTSAVT
jgi:hypothetical protein